MLLSKSRLNLLRIKQFRQQEENIWKLIGKKYLGKTHYQIVNNNRHNLYDNSIQRYFTASQDKQPKDVQQAQSSNPPTKRKPKKKKLPLEISKEIPKEIPQNEVQQRLNNVLLERNIISKSCHDLLNMSKVSKDSIQIKRICILSIIQNHSKLPAYNFSNKNDLEKYFYDGKIVEKIINENYLDKNILPFIKDYAKTELELEPTDFYMIAQKHILQNQQLVTFEQPLYLNDYFKIYKSILAYELEGQISLEFLEKSIKGLDKEQNQKKDGMIIPKKAFMMFLQLLNNTPLIKDLSKDSFTKLFECLNKLMGFISQKVPFNLGHIQKTFVYVNFQLKSHEYSINRFALPGLVPMIKDEFIRELMEKTNLLAENNIDGLVHDKVLIKDQWMIVAYNPNLYFQILDFCNLTGNCDKQIQKLAEECLSTLMFDMTNKYLAPNSSSLNKTDPIDKKDKTFKFQPTILSQEAKNQHEIIKGAMIAFNHLANVSDNLIFLTRLNKYQINSEEIKNSNIDNFSSVFDYAYMFIFLKNLSRIECNYLYESLSFDYIKHVYDDKVSYTRFKVLTSKKLRNTIHDLNQDGKLFRETNHLWILFQDYIFFNRQISFMEKKLGGGDWNSDFEAKRNFITKIYQNLDNVLNENLNSLTFLDGVDDKYKTYWVLRLIECVLYFYTTRTNQFIDIDLLLNGDFDQILALQQQDISEKEGNDQKILDDIFERRAVEAESINNQTLFRKSKENMLNEENKRENMRLDSNFKVYQKEEGLIYMNLQKKSHLLKILKKLIEFTKDDEFKKEKQNFRSKIQSKINLDQAKYDFNLKEFFGNEEKYELEFEREELNHFCDVFIKYKPNGEDGIKEVGRECILEFDGSFHYNKYGDNQSGLNHRTKERNLLYLMMNKRLVTQSTNKLIDGESGKVYGNVNKAVLEKIDAVLLKGEIIELSDQTNLKNCIFIGV